jgi:hypothetical protein
MNASRPTLLNIRRLAAPLLLALALLAPVGCVENRVLPSEVPAVGSSASALIGPAGGTLSIGDMRIDVPAGAIATDTMITVHVDDGASAPFAAYSPVLRFEPAGLTFAMPVLAHIPFRGDAGLANAFVASDGHSYAPSSTSVVGDVAITELKTLSMAFVGSACTGADCLCEPIGTLDLLLVIDDSNSMVEEQALLRAEFPGLFRALATGDLDGDGVQDVAAFDDVRVGITSTDLGAGATGGIPTCAPGFGDDGILRDVPGPTADASCTTPTYASAYAPYSGAMPAGLDGFIAQISCTSALGNSGCGFEQQLEAGLLALSPNAATSYTAPGWTVPAFPEGRMGQGDLANAGFLRDGSVLAVIFVTDEDDCSTTTSGLFDGSDPRFAGVDLNLRCTSFEDQLLTISSIASGLTGLRPRAEDVVVGAITGVPMDLPTTDLAGLLADPRMSAVPDASGTRLVPACDSPNGSATPARRIVQTLEAVEGAGGQVILQSICDPSFATFTSDLAHALARRGGGSC